MKKRILSALLCLAVAVSTLLPLSGCSVREGDLMSGVRARAVSTDVDLNSKEAAAVMDFSVGLFQKSLEEGKNVMISPLSVLCALAMTANGAKVL